MAQVASVEALEQLAIPMRAKGWRGYVDLPDPDTASDRGLLRVSGWVTSLDPTTEPGSVSLHRGDGTAIVRVPRNVYRPDVAAGVPGAPDHAGFTVEYDFGSTESVVTICADDVAIGRIHFGAPVVGEASQRGEDTVLRYLLPANAPKFLFDVGAHDGSHLSNSASFIDAGWEGVLVEPSPVPFAALSTKYASNDRAHCVQAACSDHAGTERLFFGSDHDGGTNATLCTDDNEWFASTRSERAIEVPVTTLNDLCTYYSAPVVFGLLLVDAEGMDLEVLRGLTAAEHRPLVVCTERYLHRLDKEDMKAELLRSWGLVHHGAVGWNDLWVDPTISQF
jgi:FkbM family methyltransferase